MPNGYRKTKEEWAKEQEVKLSKRLSYILRYGAEKDGMKVYEGGFVKLQDLMQSPLMRYNKVSDVLSLVVSSTSHRGNQRFEQKMENNVMYVRAMYGRRMERNPNHEDSNIPRLMELCLDTICTNLDDYDMDGFPDEFLLNTMIHRLRRQKKLTNKSFKVLLTPVIEHLDLGYVYLTEGTLKRVARNCPYLKVLNLRESGYVVTDHIIEMMLKKTNQLTSINFSGCHHLTDRTINAICKNLKYIEQLNFTKVTQITEAAVFKLIEKCPTLNHLDIYDNANISQGGRAKLKEMCDDKDRKLTVLLDGLIIESQDDNPSLSLCLAPTAESW